MPPSNFKDEFMLRINTNVSALNTLRAMGSTDLQLSKSLERLSSGLRVNRAADDAAGLSISENLAAQLRGGQRAAQNIQDGISLINVAEGALNEIHDILQRMNTLAVQASNGTLTVADRGALNQEFLALQAEIGNIATNTTFNGRALFSGVASPPLTGNFTTNTAVATNTGTTTFTLNGPAQAASALNSLTLTATSTADPGPPIVPSVVTVLNASDVTITQNPQGFNGTTPLYSYTVTLDNTLLGGNGPYTVSSTANMTYHVSTDPLEIEIQIGANEGQTETISIPPVNVAAIGVGSANVTTFATAQTAITSIQQAISRVSTIRSGLGASSNGLSHAHNAVMVAVESQVAANSRIRDADMASMMTQLTRQQILMQSSTSMLSIANNNQVIGRLLNG